MKKIKATLAAIILATGLLGCPNQNSNQNLPETTLSDEIAPIHSLSIGQRMIEKEYFPSVFSYQGMPTKDTFSLATGTNYGKGILTNTFYSIHDKEITTRNHKFKVIAVDNEHIELKYLGKN